MTPLLCYKIITLTDIVLRFSDLAYANVEPEDIYANLKRVWDLALLNNSKVLALTIPEVGVLGFRAGLDERRNKVNDLIKNHKQDNLYVQPLLFHACRIVFAPANMASPTVTFSICTPLFLSTRCRLATARNTGPTTYTSRRRATTSSDRKWAYP
jgi:hypothetical protein